MGKMMPAKWVWASFNEEGASAIYRLGMVNDFDFKIAGEDACMGTNGHVHYLAC